MLTLHNLKPAKGSTRRKKRLGRGNSSGSGNYSTRGMKGQRSRAGGKSGLASRSIKSYLLRIPKTRGFQSLNSDIATVNLRNLEDNFSSGAKINIRELLKEGLIKTTAHGVKILSAGKLTKEFTITANAFSKAAVKEIVKAGGEAIVVKVKEKVNKKKEDK